MPRVADWPGVSSMDVSFFCMCVCWLLRPNLRPGPSTNCSLYTVQLYNSRTVCVCAYCHLTSVAALCSLLTHTACRGSGSLSVSLSLWLACGAYSLDVTEYCTLYFGFTVTHIFSCIVYFVYIYIFIYVVAGTAVY